MEIVTEERYLNFPTFDVDGRPAFFASHICTSLYVLDNKAGKYKQTDSYTLLGIHSRNEIVERYFNKKEQDIEKHLDNIANPPKQ